MSQLDLEGIASYQPSQRAQVLATLASLRLDWQKVTEGKSLLEVEAPVGLLLCDIAERLDFNPQERHVLLGGGLIDEINSLLDSSVNLNEN